MIRPARQGKCAGINCDAKPSIALNYGPVDLGEACFPCANKFMLMLAPYNMEGGASFLLTVRGYREWRKATGHPISTEEASKAVQDAIAAHNAKHAAHAAELHGTTEKGAGR